MIKQPKSEAWLWPDTIISKRESRELREEHNRLVNSHADLLAALEALVALRSNLSCTNTPWEAARVAIANAHAYRVWGSEQKRPRECRAPRAGQHPL